MRALCLLLFSLAIPALAQDSTAPEPEANPGRPTVSTPAALTPVGRMQAMRQRLSAVRAATAAIRAPLARFYEALDQGQKLRFAGMS